VGYPLAVTNIEAAVVGLVQGLTEFLPVSSTAHLLFAEKLMGVEAAAVRWIEVATHLGTIGAVILYYRKDLAAMVRDVVKGGPERRIAMLVVVATAATGVVMIARKLFPGIRAWRDDAHLAAIGLIAVGVFLIGTHFARRRASGEPNFVDAVCMGLGQSVSAVVTGWSRSGSTIGTGLFRGLDAAWAARFSFLMSIPAVIAGSIVEYHDMTKDATQPPSPGAAPLLLAAAVAFASGLVAIYVVLKIVARGRLAVFGPYCIAVGAAALIWLV
jgi:undecaprenyl-diphosphatase